MDERSRPVHYFWTQTVTRAAESRFTLATIVLTIFCILGILSYGVLEQNHQFTRSQERQLQLLEANQRIMEFLEDFAVVESEADAAGRTALATNLRCLGLMFVPNGPVGPPTEETVTQCFTAPPPAPNPETVPDRIPDRIPEGADTERD